MTNTCNQNMLDELTLTGAPIFDLARKNNAIGDAPPAWKDLNIHQLSQNLVEIIRNSQGGGAANDDQMRSEDIHSIADTIEVFLVAAVGAVMVSGDTPGAAILAVVGEVAVRLARYNANQLEIHERHKPFGRTRTSGGKRRKSKKRRRTKKTRRTKKI